MKKMTFASLGVLVMILTASALPAAEHPATAWPVPLGHP